MEIVNNSAIIRSGRYLMSAIGRIAPINRLHPSKEELSFEEVRKRKLFGALMVPGILILMTFGIHHLLNGNATEGWIDLIASIWMITCVLLLQVMENGRVVYRTNATFLGLLFLFLAASGGIDGNRLFWMFSFPLIAFYTLGVKDGLTWTTTLFTLCLGILFWPMETDWLHAYDMEFKIRFCVAFALVAGMTYIYETVRGNVQFLLENEQRNLETEKQKLAQMTQSVQAANRALIKSEQRLKKAQAIARVGNFEYDSNADRLWGSDEALRILGLGSPEHICLRDLKDRVPMFYDFIDGCRNRKESEGKLSIEPTASEGNASEKTIVYARVESKPAAVGSRPKIVGVIQDISAQHRAEQEKKELETKLARSQKMEALGLLAGCVAHDLNNVLSGILSYPDLMLMRLPTDSNLREPLSVMRESGQKAAAIVQDLLTLARRGVASVEVLNLNKLIDEYLTSPEFYKLQSYHPDVRIDVNKHANLLNIKGSAVHLRKTLMNMVSNAAEALPESGRILIYTQNRYLSRPLKGYNDITAGEYAVMGIEDNGSGIHADDLERIFEPFFTKKKMGRSGTGLGLAVVWGTVEDHSGYIDVSSSQGQGTRIELFLPITHDRPEHQEKPATNASQEKYRGNGEQILVVDDMKVQRQIAREMLTILGYRVETAASGEEAIAFCRDCSVDLVILDMIMTSGIDGLETYRRLRALRPDQKTLIVSGFSETGRVKKAQRLGAGAYVKKPFNIQAIGEAIKKELEK